MTQKTFLTLFFLLGLFNSLHGQQITAYIHYPTDSTVVIDPLENIETPQANYSIQLQQPSRSTASLLPDGKILYRANSMEDVVYGDLMSYSFNNNVYYQYSIQIQPIFDGGMPNLPPQNGEVTSSGLF